ncbi:hypothetical protein [Sphingomonas sp. DT-51]|uniref:hypothetical protein n=1 Tax=Sphingomonas sp. DT-51 TaxID=3396165 RepID=UPI003F542443
MCRSLAVPARAVSGDTGMAQYRLVAAPTLAYHARDRAGARRMIGRLSPRLVAAGLLVASVPAAAQQRAADSDAAIAADSLAAPPPADQRLADNGDIIIAAPTRKVISQQVRQVTGPASQNAPLARFQSPVCVAVGGLSAGLAGAIAQRMLEDAERAGMTLGGERCRPNTMMLFVDDARAELSRMIKRNHRALQGVGAATRRALLKARGPAFAWRLTEIRTRDGESQLPEDGPAVYRVATASRINQPVRQDVITAVLIVERRAAVGKTSQQLADYGALRLFAGARELTAGGLASVLTLFGPAATAPAELTAFDRGYLRGLYTGAANAFAYSQRGRMADAIARETAAAHAAGPATP